MQIPLHSDMKFSLETVTRRYVIFLAKYHLRMLMKEFNDYKFDSMEHGRIFFGYCQLLQVCRN